MEPLMFIDFCFHDLGSSLNALSFWTPLTIIRRCLQRDRLNLIVKYLFQNICQVITSISICITYIPTSNQYACYSFIDKCIGGGWLDSLSLMPVCQIWWWFALHVDQLSFVCGDGCMLVLVLFSSKVWS